MSEEKKFINDKEWDDFVKQIVRAKAVFTERLKWIDEFLDNIKRGNIRKDGS